MLFRSRRLRIDVVEQNGEYKVLAELPGVRKEDINVQVDGDQVSIVAEVKVEREAREGERVLHTERYAGKLARSFRLGEEIDEGRVSAKYTDGVLELRLPKKAPVAAKQITINNQAVTLPELQGKFRQYDIRRVIAHAEPIGRARHRL